jgi:hypothetical protein
MGDPFLAHPNQASVHTLRCGCCGNTVLCTAIEILSLAPTGWLRCCGEIMMPKDFETVLSKRQAA